MDFFIFYHYSSRNRCKIADDLILVINHFALYHQRLTIEIFKYFSVDKHMRSSTVYTVYVLYIYMFYSLQCIQCTLYSTVYTVYVLYIYMFYILGGAPQPLLGAQHLSRRKAPGRRSGSFCFCNKMTELFG